MMPISGLSVPILISLASTSPLAEHPPEEPQTKPAPVIEEEPDAWSFAIRPYLWAPGIDGTTTVGNLPPVEFERDFDDIVSELDFAFMLGFEARPPGGELGVVVDSLYIDLEGAADAVDWELEQLVVELDLAWRVAKNLDVLTGARYVGFETDLTTTQSGLAAGGNEDWVDPIIGARGAVELGERWTLAGRGDVGGFGLGSELSWQVAGYVLFGLSKGVDIGLGYRHLDVDFEDGQLDIDLGYSGPVLGFEFRL